MAIAATITRAASGPANRDITNVSAINGGTTAVYGMTIRVATEIQLMTITSAGATAVAGSSYGVRLYNNTAGVLFSLGDPDRLHVRKLANTDCAQFTAEPGTFYTAERHPRIGGDHGIKKYHASLQF